MQFIYQIPIIDLRPVLSPDSILEVWPSPDLSKDQLDELMSKTPFIRNFGKIESGPDGYRSNINCLKFSGSGSPAFSPEGDTLCGSIYNVHKKLSAAGTYAVKAEFGFSDGLEDQLESAADALPVHLSDVLSYYAGLKVNVQKLGTRDDNDQALRHKEENWALTSLLETGNILAKNYSRATAKYLKKDFADGYVTAGESCIAVICAKNDHLILPANAQKLDEFMIGDDAVKLFGYKWQQKEVSFKVWVFMLSDPAMLTSTTVSLTLQNRLQNLFRVNAEKESVRLLMNNFNPDQASGTLKNYITKIPQRLFKKERFSTAQDGVRDFALQSNSANVNFPSIEDVINKVLDQYGIANLKNLEKGMKKSPPKKTILFVTSNPLDSNTIDFGEQFKNIMESWTSGTAREYFEVLPPATGLEREKLPDMLYDIMPDYLHITLHASEVAGLYFQNDKKKAEPMPAEEFADYIKLLTTLKKPEAVILCACNSLGHAKAIKDYCNFSIGTNYVFPDNAAILYTNKFYTSLFHGREVRLCHEAAVQGIQYSRPAFEAIDEREVYKIPQLL